MLVGWQCRAEGLEGWEVGVMRIFFFDGEIGVILG